MNLAPAELHQAAHRVHQIAVVNAKQSAEATFRHQGGFIIQRSASDGLSYRGRRVLSNVGQDPGEHRRSILFLTGKLNDQAETFRLRHGLQRRHRSAQMRQRRAG